MAINRICQPLSSLLNRRRPLALLPGGMRKASGMGIETGEDKEGSVEGRLKSEGVGMRCPGRAVLHSIVFVNVFTINPYKMHVIRNINLTTQDTMMKNTKLQYVLESGLGWKPGWWLRSRDRSHDGYRKPRPKPKPVASILKCRKPKPNPVASKIII